jgi:hypothetical protein
MALYKIQAQSPITYDSYGNPLGTPVIILEDIFLNQSNYSEFLATSPLKSFHVTHIKRLEFGSIDFSEYSTLHTTIKLLEDIILSFPTKMILLAIGKSAGLSLQLSLNATNKIYSSYIINPELKEIESEEDLPFKEFWDWFSKREDFLSLIPKTPYLFDFFLKYRKFINLISLQEQSMSIHFLFSNPPSFQKIETIRQISPKSLISVFDSKNTTSSLENKSLQKLILWFTEKDNLQISKE